MGQIAKILLVSLILLLPVTREAKAEFTDLLHVGAAFMTNLALHESSHYILADHEGAEG
ncbi:MAG: hypothetical protein HY760_00660, partial [Nitrospirae bacterium]|nr:hypothetical protein [Nitrospirota bacterium]